MKSDLTIRGELAADDADDSSDNDALAVEAEAELRDDLDALVRVGTLFETYQAFFSNDASDADRAEVAVEQLETALNALDNVYRMQSELLAELTGEEPEHDEHVCDECQPKIVPLRVLQ